MSLLKLMFSLVVFILIHILNCALLLYCKTKVSVKNGMRRFGEAGSNEFKEIAKW